VEATLERTLRQTWAFMFRGYHLTRRYLSWVIVFNFYALTGSAAVALIGVAANDHQLTLTLVVGALLWNFLSILYNEIAMSVAYERWEGTLEYTFMAPVPRLVHLVGLSLFALCNSVVNTVVVLLGLMLFTDLSLAGANLVGVVVVLLASTMAFVGLGVMAAALPVMSPERGAEATHISRERSSWCRASTIRWRYCRPGCSRSRLYHRRPTRWRPVASSSASGIRPRRPRGWRAPHCQPWPGSWPCSS
jgi:ABC-2 type transport system permease protein